MKTTRKKRLTGARPGTISKYLNCLTAYQQRSGKITNLNEMSAQFSVSRQIGSFLFQKGIIYKENGSYHWNNAYEPNVKIVNGILDYVRINNNNNLIKKKYKQTPTLFDQKRQYKRKVKIEPETLQEQPKNTNTVEIGVIRKFIKWLW